MANMSLTQALSCPSQPTADAPGKGKEVRSGGEGGRRRCNPTVHLILCKNSAALRALAIADSKPCFYTPAGEGEDGIEREGRGHALAAESVEAL